MYDMRIAHASRKECTMATKRDRGDYFKRRRAAKAAELAELKAKSEPPTDKQLSSTIVLRLSPAAVHAIDDARGNGLFQRSRSEFVRDAVSHYLKAGAGLCAVIAILASLSAPADAHRRGSCGQELDAMADAIEAGNDVLARFNDAWERDPNFPITPEGRLLTVEQGRHQIALNGAMTAYIVCVEVGRQSKTEPDDQHDAGVFYMDCSGAPQDVSLPDDVDIECY